MCSSPLTKDGNTFSCRRCNECVAARRADWVSRAMAEKSLHEYALVYALTYGDETQEQRDGAAMFRYADIKALLDRLRRHIFYKTGKRQAIRFLCAGEQGDRNGRCHWHMVIFSDIDLTTVGTYSAPWGVVTKRDQIVTGPNGRKLRRNWSMWPHGFIVVQEPDVGGMHYALSYALKDQFSIDKAKGSFREAKAENYATGMFRMSKKPPIGWDFIDQKLKRLGENNTIPPNLKVTVPEQKHYWYPRGAIRTKFLEGLRDINEQIAARTGRNAPQWSTLLHNCKENEADLEILLDVKENEEESIELSIRKRSAEQAHEQRRKDTLRRCGSTVACSACLRGTPDHLLPAFGIEIYQDEAGRDQYRIAGEKTGDTLRAKQRDAANRGINSLCGLSGTSYAAQVFGPAKHCGNNDEAK